MIRHVVLFRLAAEDLQTRREHAAEIARRLESLRGRIPGLLAIEVGRPIGDDEMPDWHAALISEHTDQDALAAYQRHPEHQEIVAWVSTVVADRAVLDYESS